MVEFPGGSYGLFVCISFDKNRGDWRYAIGLDGMEWTNGLNLRDFASSMARTALWRRGFVRMHFVT
ncbi:hypothetical protein [Butyricimonas synergistica]|uniref:hypothetical protein n=1 Tax=Butyricimonas synergistica TaxID=544644 RepID=UPI0003A9B4FA|nr:hypothetical protein [Butyricimonas synergistica]